MLATERRDLLNQGEQEWTEDVLPEPYRNKIIPWHSETAEIKFLFQFFLLNKQKDCNYDD